MDELITNVANLGFPIAVSIYLLVRLEGKMDALTSTISKMNLLIEERLDKK